jgi:hypothetical protein
MNATVSDEGLAPAMPQINEAEKHTLQKTKASAHPGSAAWLVAALLVLSL